MMDDTALKDQPVSGKSERACAWCGADISHRQKNATLCSNRCKKASYNHRHRQEINAKQKERNKTPAAKASNARYSEKRKQRNAEIRVKKWPKSPAQCLVYFNTCRWCGSAFSSNCPHSTYCGSDHRRLAFQERQRLSGLKAAADKRYRQKHADKLRVFWNERDKIKRRENPDKERQKEREKWRNRAAQSALATILLPTHRTKEHDQ